MQDWYVNGYAPVGHRQSFRQVLTLAAVHDLELQALDVTAAFLHGKLEEPVYMHLPPELNDVGYRGKVALLKRALYGLKEAPARWNETIDTWLRTQHWQPSPQDPCVYIHKTDGTVDMILYLHVDDSAIAGRHAKDIDDFINTMHLRFHCLRQGELRYFLGMEIHRDRSARKLWITQHQYTNKILDKFGLSQCSPNRVPISPSVASKLVQGSPSDHDEASHLPFREIMGSLQYAATMTRVDITFAVRKLSSYNACWTRPQFELAKGVLRYLAGTRDWGLCLGSSSDGLVGYVDADYNGCRDTMKSTTGWIVMYHGGVIGYKSKRQTVVSHSTAESEYMALDDIARNLIWERRALTYLGERQVTDAPVKVDNQASLRLSRNRTNHDSTKHIDQTSSPKHCLKIYFFTIASSGRV